MADYQVTHWQFLYYPQVNYGQGSGVWVPSTRGPVYQQTERARFEPSFALMFAMDILFGKQDSGDKFYMWDTKEETWVDKYGDEHTRTVIVRALTRTQDSSNQGWLYNRNTLNPHQSWVPQMFGLPVTRIDGAWCWIKPCTQSRLGNLGAGPIPPGVARFTFVPQWAVSDAETIRMLDEGHWAFSATDSFGTLVRVPWGSDAKPRKQGRGRIEAGNSKRTPHGRFYA